MNDYIRKDLQNGRQSCIMKVSNFAFNKQPNDIYVKLIHCRGLYLMNTENLCDSNVSYGIPHMK